MPELGTAIANSFGAGEVFPPRCAVPSGAETMLMLLKKAKNAGEIRTPRARRSQPLRRVIAATLVSTLSTPVAFANVVGTDMQNFNPTTSGLDFVTVHSSETLEPGVINFGLYLNYAVNTLPYFDDTPQGRTKFSDSLLGADLNIGLGLLPNWDVGLSVPQVLYQDIKSSGYHGQFSNNGNTELRINSKVRLYGDREGGIAVVGSANVNRVKNNPFVGRDAGPIYNLELAADTTFNKVAVGVNAGHRWRKRGLKLDKDTPIDPLGNQWIASAAVSYLLASIDTKLIFEVFGSKPDEPETERTKRLAESAEALLGAKYDFSSALAGHFGAGTELINGRASPDWRIYAGLNYALGPTFGKRSAEKNEVGHPKPAQASANPFAGPPKATEKIVIHDVLFEFDSATLVVGGAQDTLKRLAEYVLIKPSYKLLVIEGHTDSVGSDAYNLDLSRRRAETIRNWLIAKYRMDPKKIQAVGKGERAPIADNGNYQGRQLNRRVEFTIYREAK